MVSKIQWKPFWLATQLYPQNDWAGWQFGINPWRTRTGPTAPLFLTRQTVYAVDNRQTSFFGGKYQIQRNLRKQSSNTNMKRAWEGNGYGRVAKIKSKKKNLIQMTKSGITYRPDKLQHKTWRKKKESQILNFVVNGEKSLQKLNLLNFFLGVFCAVTHVTSSRTFLVWWLPFSSFFAWLTFGNGFRPSLFWRSSVFGHFVALLSNSIEISSQLEPFIQSPLTCFVPL